MYQYLHRFINTNRDVSLPIQMYQYQHRGINRFNTNENILKRCHSVTASQTLLCLVNSLRQEMKTEVLELITDITIFLDNWYNSCFHEFFLMEISVELTSCFVMRKLNDKTKSQALATFFSICSVTF